MSQEEFFDQYEIDIANGRLGGGAFGTVYKAYDHVNSLWKAVKIAEVKIISGKEFSLISEFNATKDLKAHKNIANYEAVYQFTMPNGKFDYALMQYYPYGNLKELLKNQALNQEQKKRICIGIINGISYLHRHKVIHRDIKPSNILISEFNGDFTPKIADFGLSKLTNTGELSEITNSFGGGTLEYSSPEQLLGETLRYNADLWAVGVILYEIFVGRIPFDSDSFVGSDAARRVMIYQNIGKAVTPKDLEQCPAPFNKIIEDCLKKDPNERIQNANDIVQYFEKQKKLSSSTPSVIPKTTVTDDETIVMSPTDIKKHVEEEKAKKKEIERLERERINAEILAKEEAAKLKEKQLIEEEQKRIDEQIRLAQIKREENKRREDEERKQKEKALAAAALVAKRKKEKESQIEKERIEKEKAVQKEIDQQKRESAAIEKREKEKQQKAAKEKEDRRKREEQNAILKEKKKEAERKKKLELERKAEEKALKKAKAQILADERKEKRTIWWKKNKRKTGLLLLLLSFSGTLFLGYRHMTQGPILYNENGLYGYKTASGEIFIAAQYKNASRYWLGKATVVTGNYKITLDKNGNVIDQKTISTNHDSDGMGDTQSEYFLEEGKATADNDNTILQTANDTDGNIVTQKTKINLDESQDGNINKYNTEDSSPSVEVLNENNKKQIDPDSKTVVTTPNQSNDRILNTPIEKNAKEFEDSQKNKEVKNKQQNDVAEINRPRNLLDEKSNEEMPLPAMILDVEKSLFNISGGNFTLGCINPDDNCQTDEMPSKQIWIDNFYISKYEVTQEEYEYIMGSNPSYNKDCKKCPVENVSWIDAQSYIQKLNDLPGNRYTYRLPTEAEWEYAAAGGEDYIYAGSDEIDDVAQYKSNNGVGSVSVTKTKKNGFGLKGMSGNISEWCADWYDKNAYKSGIKSKKEKVIRGGSWLDRKRACRVKNRDSAYPDETKPTIGFRIVRTAK